MRSQHRSQPEKSVAAIYIYLKVGSQVKYLTASVDRKYFGRKTNLSDLPAFPAYSTNFISLIFIPFLTLMTTSIPSTTHAKIVYSPLSAFLHSLRM